MAHKPAKALLSRYYKDVYNTEAGAHVFADLLARANVFAPVCTSDPLEMARLEGERNCALRIVEMLALQPGDFISTAIEQHNILDHLLTAADERGQ